MVIVNVLSYICLIALYFLPTNGDCFEEVITFDTAKACEILAKYKVEHLSKYKKIYIGFECDLNLVNILTAPRDSFINELNTHKKTMYLPINNALINQQNGILLAEKLKRGEGILIIKLVKVLEEKKLELESIVSNIIGSYSYYYRMEKDGGTWNIYPIGLGKIP